MRPQYISGGRAVSSRSLLSLSTYVFYFWKLVALVSLFFSSLLPERPVNGNGASFGGMGLLAHAVAANAPLPVSFLTVKRPAGRGTTAGGGGRPGGDGGGGGAPPRGMANVRGIDHSAACAPGGG